MIPSGFYPANVSLTNQNLELTNYIMDIPITSQSFSDAYWLGWINYDNLPTSFRVSAYDVDTESGECSFTDVTAQKNYPIGYTCYYSQAVSTLYYTNPGYDTYRANDGQTDYKWRDARACWSSWDSSKYMRLPNDLDINTLSWGSIVKIYIYGRVTDGSDFASIAGVFDTTSFSLDGSFTITFNKIYGSLQYQSTTMTLDFDAFESGVYEFTENGLTYKLAITNWEAFYNRDINTDNSLSSNYTNAKPTILVEDDTGYEHLIAIMTSSYTIPEGYQWGSGKFYNGCCLYPDGHVPDVTMGGCQFNRYDGIDRVYGGFVGTFNLNDLNFTSYETYFFEGANFLLTAVGRNDFMFILRIYEINDIRRCLALLPRQTALTTQRYENSSDYLYAHVSEDNEFLCELVDGSPQSVQNELREWQIVGHTIVDNNFDPEDIPPYEPYPPGSDLEELGDSIDIQKPSIGVANNFLTMYALTETQVSNFGSVLWTSWVEEISPGEWSLTKMIDNFTAGFDLLTTTASFDIASVLQFIVSLRVYPFSLVNLHITQNAGQVAYIGRGEYGINCGGGQNILKFTESMGYLDAGSLTVPRHFGDWRDHDNTTVMAYLPYCGTVELNPSDVVGRTLVCTYAVDVYTGQCMAIIESYSPEDLGGKHYPIAIASGTIGVSIPVSTTNSGQIAGAFINSAMNIMQIVSGAATDAAMQIAGAELAMNSKAMSKQSTAYKEAYAQQQAAGIATNLGNAGLGVENEALGYLSSKGVGFPTLSGGSGLTSFMEPSSAYIQIRRGLYKTNDQYDHTNGKPSTDARPLSSYIGTGLTICNNVDVSGLTCHEYEKAAIKEMLASGVYL